MIPDHYIDIHLQPDPELGPQVLMDALFNKLHRILVQLGSNTIGVSFPDYSLTPRTLGLRLRLHGPRDALQALQGAKWLGAISSYVTSSQLAPIPPGAQHCAVRRQQAKTNAERIRRRWARRHGKTLEEARQEIPATAARRVRLPSVVLRSSSTAESSTDGRRFHLFIRQSKPQAASQDGRFNSYGLSPTATVPWF